jgi:hypothetical protein
MAFRLDGDTGIPGMDHIWNVSQQVGGLTTCPNLPTDVELVKVLLKQTFRHPDVVARSSKVFKPPLVVNGEFDAIVGYWIFRFQTHTGHPIIDGIVSPAHGFAYTQGSPWVIARINHFAFLVDNDFWENLDQNFSISPQLRDELTRQLL